MLRTRRISDTFEQRVYTDQGEYFGDVEECILTISKIFGWRVKATKGSSLSNLLGGAKGVIVPHQLVKAIGDILIISKAAIPSYGVEEGKEDKEEVID